MDKITRILVLYSALINGEEINKTLFCFENNCSPRSFDRDIEDIRLFLSESFSVLELTYSRETNTYHINGTKKQQLEVMEYLFIEKILKDTAILRDDEYGMLKHHLLMNTRDSSKMMTLLNKDHILYKSPNHNIALLKIHGDLELAIRTQKYIRLVYYDNFGIQHTCNLTPCAIKYKLGELYFIGYTDDESTPFDIELQRIYSFDILRNQTIDEIKKVDMYITGSKNNSFSKGQSDLIEIIFECIIENYENVKNTFDAVEIVWQKHGLARIKINANEAMFIQWYLDCYIESITIIEPQYLKDRFILQAKKLLEKYGE